MSNSYGVQLLPLLSATMRIADIHDANRQIGVSVNAPKEDRPQNSNGLWLEVAARLLHHLHDEDVYANEGWVNLDVFSTDMEKMLEISSQDVQYVINFLATPTRITVCEIDDGVIAPKSTKSSALIERPLGYGGNRARLTEAGRRTLQLSQTAQNWLYADHDTEKILRAIDLKDFGSIPQLCLSLSQSIRSFAHQIRRIMERPGLEEVMEAYRTQSSEYRETIKRVTQAVMTASKRLAENDTQEAFLVWLDANADSEIDPHYVQRTLDELMQSVERLGRLFSRFIEVILDNNREIIGCIRFDRAAIHLACRSPTSTLEKAAFNAIGPWGVSLSFPSPDDFIGCLKIIETKEKVKPIVFDGSPHSDSQPPIYRFLEKHRTKIIEQIAAGPISVSDAVNSGWAEIDGELFTGQLVGVFSTPGWLGAPEANIRLSIDKDGLRVPLPDGRILVGDDLIISLEEPTDGV